MSYPFLFLWLGLLYIFKVTTASYWITEENGFPQRQTPKLNAVLAFIPIIYFVVSNSMFSGDLYFYVLKIQNLPTQWDEIILFFRGLENSPLFWAFWILVKAVLGDGQSTIRFILAIFHAIPCIWLFRKYSDDYWLCVYLFVASSFPMAWMMNGVRQFAAAVIIYMATPYMVEKQWSKWVFWVLVATLVHQTAIIMLPIIYVALGTAWNRKTMLMLFGAIAAAVMFSTVSGSVDNLLTTAGYATEEYALDNGVHPLRVLVNFVPVALAFYGRNDIDLENSPFMNLIVNMSIANFALYLIGMVTSGILVGRIPAYTNLYSFLLLSNIVSQIFPVSTEKTIKVLMVACYGLFFYVQM